MTSPTPAETTFETPGGSIFSPSTLETTQEAELSTLDKLNEYLQSRDISPIRNTLNVPWIEASDRTKRRHTRKAKHAVQAVLEEVAPSQSDDLWQSVVTAMSTGKESVDDEVLMRALAECYYNASSSGARRQILSIMADKKSYAEITMYIPEVTRYRFTVARNHILAHGRGVPVPKKTQTRMFVSDAQLEHFLDFITSPYVIQDMPYGQKSIKLSTNEILEVPNVVRMLIPESITKQYLSYAEEKGFKPLSRSTLLRILSVGSEFVRKSLQGLDYKSSSGAQSFDDLVEVVDKLGDLCMGMDWAKTKKEQLKSSKRYLKSDFKVL